MTTFVTVIHIVTCVLLVLVVLIQSGKGAEISASFSGSSQTVFGSSGRRQFLHPVYSRCGGGFLHHLDDADDLGWHESEELV